MVTGLRKDMNLFRTLNYTFLWASKWSCPVNNWIYGARVQKKDWAEI